MTTQEHLLTVVAEECAEVAQAITKALRFGLDDAHPKNGNLGNRELIAREVEDLLGALKMLELRGIIRPPTHLGIMNKRARVHEFLEYSKRVGTLTDSNMDCGGKAPSDDTALASRSDSPFEISNVKSEIT